MPRQTNKAKASPASPMPSQLKTKNKVSPMDRLKEIDMEFLQSIDWMQLLRCFVVGGMICIVGQILIDKTKLTPARILVVFVTLGAILGGLGIYQYIIDFAGCGATVPLTGFGANLAKGAMEAVKDNGLLGAFIGGVKASSGGIAAAVFFGYLASLISKPKMKKQ